MAEGRQTTIRFSEPMYRRLEFAGQVTGLPINSIVVIACLEWLDAHQPSMPQMGPLTQTQMFAHLGTPFGWRKGTYPFDRFTERAKRVLAIAQEEAGRFEKGIGAGHLLLGLVLEHHGIAGQVLAGIGLGPESIRETIRSAAGPETEQEVAGQPTAELKRVIDGAFRQAQRFKHDYIGTEHLLLSLTESSDPMIKGIFSAAGTSLEGVRAEMERGMVQGTS